MAQNKLILRKLQSPYLGQFDDITKGSVLTHSELDGNQIFIKGELIYSATTNGTTLVFPQIKGTDIQVDIDDLISDSASSTISGTSFDNSSFILTIDRNDGTSYTENLSALASDVFVLSGVYNSTNGTLEFTTNSGDTFSMSGFSTGMTNYYTTGTTLGGDNVVYVDRTDTLSAYTIDLSPMGQTGSTLVPLIFNQALGVPNTSIQPSFGTHSLDSGSTYSSILGGKNNEISGGTEIFVIGSNITGTTANTTYVNNLNIYDTPVSSITISTLLVRDTDGTVSVREVDSLFGTGTTLSASTPFEFTTGTTLGSIQPSDLRGVWNLGSWSTIAGGKSNTIEKGADYNFIGGGQGNDINSEHYNSIVGGSGNTMNGGNGSFIGGGYGNSVAGGLGHSLFIGGGSYNIISYSNYALIAGGSSNQIIGGVAAANNTSIIVGGIGNGLSATTHSFIGGGFGNSINHDRLGVGDNTTMYFGTILNGYLNNIFSSTKESKHNTIIGGVRNTIYNNHGYTFDILDTEYNIINNGHDNTIHNSSLSQIGGYQNMISGDTPTNSTGNIIGGDNNTILQSKKSTILNGNSHDITNNFFGLIGGGWDNELTDNNYSSILNGKDNIIRETIPASYTSKYGTILGGLENTIIGADNSFNSILGGYRNDIVGSYNFYATILGGKDNNIIGDSNFGISILGGQNNNFLDGTSEYSSIVGGNGNIIHTSVNSSILGGQSNEITTGVNNIHIIGSNITASTANTTYVEQLNLDTPLTTANTLTALLVRDIDGSIKARDADDIISAAAAASPFTASTSTNIVPTNNVNNTNSGANSTIAGGTINAITATESFIGAGLNNSVASVNGVIGGGSNNDIVGTNGAQSFIGNGLNNTITVSSTPYLHINNFIGGGQNNDMTASIASSRISNNFIGGGSANKMDTAYDCFVDTSVIVGGSSNVIRASITTPTYARLNNNFIGGGSGNKIEARVSNSIRIMRCSILGGFSNDIKSDVNDGRIYNSSILGGNANLIEVTTASLYMFNSTVVGGKNNDIIDSSYSSIIGGQSNVINGVNNVHVIGSSIIPTSANTTYVEGFNIKTVVTGNSVNDVLVRDTDGTVRVREAITINTGGTVSILGVSQPFILSSGLSLSLLPSIGGNTIDGGSGFSSIGGGSGNTITVGEGFYSFNSIGGGYRNSIIGLADTSFIGGGNDNVIDGTDASSILGGQNNMISGTTDIHIIGSNITGTTANTTYVNNFNINDLPDTENALTDLLVRDSSDGSVKIRKATSVSGATGGGSLTTKYATTSAFTENLTVTITHGMNLPLGEETDIIVKLRDLNAVPIEEIGGSIDNFMTNSVDITFSQTYSDIRVVIIG